MKTTRREFVRGIGCGAMALAIHGCASSARAREISGSEAMAERSMVGGVLSPERVRILSLAARAPSTHNAQPWRVRVLRPDEWLVGPDVTRRLPSVDPRDRELALSLGAFLEYLVTAAAALGLDARLEQDGSGAPAPGVVRVRLARAPGGARAVEQLDRIARRRTLRKGYSSAPLTKGDVAALSDALGPCARWLPRGTKEADWLAEAAAQSFEQQTWRDPAQQELARWVRFSHAASAAGDGLTPDMMEVGWLPSFYMRHFMDAESVTGKSFRDRGVDTVREQARDGAGWFVLGAADESTRSLLEAGRAYARMALLLRERSLAVHPMSQVVEEDPWHRDLGRTLGLGNPQFVLRAGYVERYPEPVSLRRPVSEFASLA